MLLGLALGIRTGRKAKAAIERTHVTYDNVTIARVRVQGARTAAIASALGFSGLIAGRIVGHGMVEALVSIAGSYTSAVFALMADGFLRRDW
jgi:hypothetical protein